MDEIALNPCMNFGALATELMIAAGVQDADGSVREQIFQAVQRDVLDAAHPEGTATLGLSQRPRDPGQGLDVVAPMDGRPGRWKDC